MSKTVRFRLAALLCLLGGFAFQAAAQEATIVGSVTDQTGAAVPGANIAITNNDTGLAQQYTTGGSGEFVAPSLHIGHYSVRAEAKGFKAAEQKDINLQVGDRSRVDFKLEVGNATEQITVEAAPVAVQADSSEISGVISTQQVLQLPTNGRNIYTLVNLLPGASSAQSGDFQVATPVSSDSNISFNGLRPGHNLYMLDGGEDLDRGGGGAFSVLPSLDSIAEFRAQTSNYDAQYGLSSAATFTMVLKSGTQQLHASAWEFVRNDALDAGAYFTNAVGGKAPELRFNNFGFNVGGPVTFGKLYNKDRNKTFFFYNMEWRKYVQGNGVINQTVPLTSQYGGNFSGAPYTISVPSAAQLAPNLLSKFTALGLQPGKPFPNNTIPAALLDPNAQTLLKAGIFPAPTSGTQFVEGAVAPTNFREEIVRIDHHFTDRFTLFGHFIAEQIDQGYTTSQWSGDNVPTIGNTFGNPSYSGVIHAIDTISPTLVNEIAFNYNGNRINIVPNGLVSQPSGLNIPRIFTGPNNLNRIPEVHLSGFNGTDYTASSWPWHNVADSYQIRDDLSWTKGSHQLKMGFSWLYYKKVQDLFGQTQGGYTFNGTYTGNDFADFLLGYSSAYTELAVQDHGNWNNQNWAAYIQDNWRVDKRLTLTLGLRWDGIPHTYEANNRMGNFYPQLYNTANAAILDPTNPNFILPSSPGLGTSPNPILAGYKFYTNGIGIPGQNGIPDGLVNNHWALFGPRVGFAYDISGRGKTVLRGGFGAMYERVQGNDMYNAGPNQPFSASVTFNNVSLSSPTTSLLTGQTLTAPITVGSLTGLNQTDYNNPVSYQFSFGVQQAIGERTVISAAYVGNQNRHQSDQEELNLPAQSNLAGLIQGTINYNTVVPYPGYHSIDVYRDAANSHYNSLQVNATSRLRSDLNFQAVYTYAKAIDATNGNGNGWDLDNVANPYNRAYGIGPAGFDRTHVFVANFVYDMPFFRTSSSKAMKTALGGWQLSGVVTAQTGLPVNVQLGGSQGSNGLPNGTNRPNVNGSVSDPHTVAQWFSTTPFSAPALGQWGNVGFDTERGPGRHNWNLSLFKNFVINERRGSRIEFRAESYNIFNHTQFQNVSNNFSAGNFGQITSAFDPRVFQLGLKAIF